ncbi:hypothetical protein KS4_31600 [Poriferisphaera corsica]|uniref:DUF1501 domain-containing protein n=1 Tax=Poriferisphaera corsica TaxID=2528020 RepID=A0A517YXX3_9BACT|nr:DUF1501 domain-containing protein [Poriferisphaera corsica]QDU35082.1 hypothetical protein KS4_31600 [Poriferisphaera corsica]
MPNKINNFTRREFLNTSLVLASTAATVPGFLLNSSNLMAAEHAKAGTASLPGIPEDRVLVVIQLSGGNDGLNTLIPYGDDHYYKARRQIAIKQKDILTLDTNHGIGLHPGMRELHSLAQAGQCIVLPGIGYPNPNRSHFASMDIYHTGDTLDPRGHGWLGKAIDQSFQKRQPKNPFSIISLGSAAPTAVQGKRAKPITFSNINSFKWGAKGRNAKLDQYYDQIQTQSVNDTAGDPALDFVYRTSLDAHIASDRVRKAVSRKPKTKFPNNKLARQLQQVAAMIADDLPTRVYYVTLGGFDTHANQLYQHQKLLSEFSAATSAFLSELQATGDSNRVMTLAFSEFGRRVEQNASSGTDHGAAGLMFVLGNHLASNSIGIHGQYPSLTDLHKGDLIFNQDFRSVYADLLDNWMKLDATASLGKQFKHTGLLSRKVMNS